MKTQQKQIIIPLLLVSMLMGCHGKTDDSFLGSGTMETDEVLVSSLLAGKLNSVLFDQGDSVDNQQLLAVVDVEKLEAQVRQNQAVLEEIGANRTVAQRSIEQAGEQLDNLSKTLDRQAALLETGSSSQQIIDDLKSQKAIASSQLQAARDQMKVLDAKKKQIEASLDLLNLQIADSRITSPLQGTVLEKYVEPGEIVSPGSPIAKITSLKDMWLKVYLSESDVDLVTVGGEVKVVLDALPDEPIKGKVVWVSPRSEFTPRNVQTRESRADLVFAVKIEIDNSNSTALIGMPAEVYLK